jgi:hypothetical protein
LIKDHGDKEAGPGEPEEPFEDSLPVGRLHQRTGQAFINEKVEAKVNSSNYGDKYDKHERTIHLLFTPFSIVAFSSFFEVLVYQFCLHFATPQCRQNLPPNFSHEGTRRH